MSPPSRTSAVHQRLTAPAARGRPAGTLVIHEIYRSLQGESTFAGLPCVFVRLTACHLRCGYCDTPHAFKQGETTDPRRGRRRALALGDDLVEITGGEPLLQHEVYPLMTRLADAGRTVLLETSGALDTSAVDPRVRVILDLKTPGSARSRPTSGATSGGSSPATSSSSSSATVPTSTGPRRGPSSIASTTLSCPLQRRFGQVNPTDLAAWIPRIAPARAAPAPAAQDPLASQGPGGFERHCLVYSMAWASGALDPAAMLLMAMSRKRLAAIADIEDGPPPPGH